LFALRKGMGEGAGDSSSQPPVSEGGLVLPRFLRRPARFLARMPESRLAPPRYAALILTTGFLALSAGYGAVLGGHVPAIVKAVTARSGFAVDEVKISGNRETSEIDVLDKLALDGWTSLVGYDAEAARERVASLPWVAKATIRKLYPDAIEVHLVERKPYAIWQHASDLSLVETDGDIIVPFRDNRYATLPLVIGPGAARTAPDLIARINAHPQLASRVKAYIRVADRRWDLRLENGVTLKLPEHREEEAIADIVAMDGEQGLLSRDIVSVDLRFDDRLVVKMTPEAALRRNAAIEQAAKARKKPERKI
jgi:cell division protein FtsQ